MIGHQSDTQDWLLINDIYSMVGVCANKHIFTVTTMHNILLPLTKQIICDVYLWVS